VTKEVLTEPPFLFLKSIYSVMIDLITAFLLMEANDLLIKGDVVHALRRIVNMMLGRGAPTEYDDLGFNKIHWQIFNAIAASPDFNNPEGMPIKLANQIVQALAIYQKRQLPELGVNYKELVGHVEAAIADVMKSSPQAQQAPVVTPGHEGKIIVFPDRQQYKKVFVKLPVVPDKGIMTVANRVVGNYLESIGAPKVADNYGKVDYEKWKYLGKDKGDIRGLWAHKEVIDAVLDALSKKYKYEVVTNDGQPYQPGMFGNEKEAEKKVEPGSDVEIHGIAQTHYGAKIKVTFGRSVADKNMYQDLKADGLAPRDISLAPENVGGKKEWYYFITPSSYLKVRAWLTRKTRISKEGIEKLDNFVKENGVHDLDQKIADQAAKAEAPEEEVKSNLNKYDIQFINGPGKTMMVRLPYIKEAADRELFKELLKYVFTPKWQPDDPSNPKKGQYVAEGEYMQYIHFGRLLQTDPYNFAPTSRTVASLKDVVRAKYADGTFDKNAPVEGSLPNPKKLPESELQKEFNDRIDKEFPNSPYELYDLQKEGAAFLYSRKHALLGDETGLGKTLECVVGAALKMKDNPSIGKTLIVTIKGGAGSTLPMQWAKTIQDVVGEDADISLDPSNPRQWTILYYQNFSAGKKENIAHNVDILKNANFGIVIFDEIHRVKHEDTATWMNIKKVIEKTPIIWGASATISANKPLDVKNQLNAIGHYLGKMSKSKFRIDFGADKWVKQSQQGEPQSDFFQKPEEEEEKPGEEGKPPEEAKKKKKMPKNMGYWKAGTPEERIRAAEKLNRWLNITGVYMRRAKSDAREMPNLSKGEKDVDIDEAKLWKAVREKASKYENPSLAISELIAVRYALAVQKTDATAAKVAEIVQAGEGKEPAASKVVVFTNFVESGRLLWAKIRSKIQDINPNYEVLTYTSDTKKAELKTVKERFTDNPNFKALVMSMRMGGTGIDFPNAAQHMVINDFDWTPESAEQSEGRIYRINTNHPVNITYMVGSGLDQSIFAKVKQKRELAAIIQKYRKDYIETGSKKDLDKIVQAQIKNDDISIEDVAKQLFSDMRSRQDQNESVSEYIKRRLRLRESHIYYVE